MRTPFGQECRYYHEDYARGRNIQECRLIEANPNSPRWSVGLCQSCPVPGILEANDCPHMMLQGRVGKGFLGLTQKVQVRAACRKYRAEVADPHVGCGHCADEIAERLVEAAAPKLHKP